MSTQLTIWDYTIVGATLLLSAGLGLYNGCLKTNQSTFLEYFLGSHTIPMFPIVMSSFATIVASGLMIGYPAEVYSYGIIVNFVMIAWIFLIPTVNLFVTPVFRKFSSGNIFQFYEVRYNKGFKKVATFLYIVASVLFASVTVYGPSIAISLVTKLNLWTVVTTMIGICMIYTILGGMRAVVFADTIQGLQMIISMIILMTVGTINLGGFSKVWTISAEGERLQIDFSFDPTITHTVWSTCIGWMFSYSCFFATNQSNMQRLLACATLKQAQRTNTISITIAIISNCFMAYLSLLAYATFSKCDPLENKQISTMNQIIPFYVMDTFSDYPGLSGLYFAGLVSASLSTLSSFINSLAAISVDTFILPKYPNMSELKRTNICKFLTFLYGGFTILTVGVIELFPNIMQAGTLIMASVSCPLFALFVVGLFCPRASSKGGIIAFVFSFLFGIWLIIGVQLSPSSIANMKPFSTEGCAAENFLNSSLQNSTLNSSLNFNIIPENTAVENLTASYVHEMHKVPAEQSSILNSAFPLAKISYMWVGCIIFWLPVVLCFIFTYIFGKDEVNKEFLDHIPPIIQRFHNHLSPILRTLFLCDLPHQAIKDFQPEEAIPLSLKKLKEDSFATS